MPVALSTSQESPAEIGNKYTRLGPPSSKIYADLSIDVICLFFGEPEMMKDFVNADIRLLALDAYWLKEWVKESDYNILRYLSRFYNLDVIFVVLNTYVDDKHTGDERLVAPETNEEIWESQTVMPVIRGFLSKCRKLSDDWKLPVIKEAVVRRGEQRELKGLGKLTIS